VAGFTGVFVRLLFLLGLYGMFSGPIAAQSTESGLPASPVDSVTPLAPFVVTGESEQPRRFDGSEPFVGPKMAAGNLDLPRTEDDTLPFIIYDRDEIERSGVVDLNEFLRRELLDAVATLPPDQNGSVNSLISGNTNLNLRGYDADETVILIDGRRLPEVLLSDRNLQSSTRAPDVSFIPLSLVQQVEVLPASASAIASGNAVGGVINIVLRPVVNATEVTTTYTNALRRFDAPQSAVSLLHGETLLGGALRVRLDASFTQTTPPTEAELGYIRARVQPSAAPGDPIYRATPNIRSADLSPLWGQGTPAVTSVAPGADGSGGLAAFAQRQGVENLDLFDPPGGMAASPNCLNYPYGLREQRSTYFGSAVYDVLPWLQLGLDGTYSRAVTSRGYDVFAADLAMGADSPYNPFGKAIKVSLNETAPLLGPDYSEARLDSWSAVLGLMLKLPSDWRVELDSQYARNLARYRGLAGADPARWQQLTDQGLYNPLRDTQVYGPPPEFYDQVLIYSGERGRFSSLGDYGTLDSAVRITNQSLTLPTGQGSLNFGGDYQRATLADSTEERRYGDGSLASPPITWTGRTLEQFSVFEELQAPLLPSRWLPHWLRKVEADLAVRYVASDASKYTNLAPTYGLKMDMAGGFSLRASLTTSNRYPTPYMSQQTAAPNGPGSGEVNYTWISDPVRHESYYVLASDVLNPELLPEAAVTQTAGLVFQRGKVHRFRAALDFFDTRKINEQYYLNAQTVLDLEPLFPGRVTRAPLASGDASAAGRVTSVVTGDVNLSWRRSQNWNISLDYAWTKCLGGTLGVYGRLVCFERYDRQVLPDSPIVDELRQPDGTAPGLLRYRANFGADWSGHRYRFGVDGHYFHSNILPSVEWASQGSDRIKPCCLFDAYLQSDLTQWLPWKSRRFGLSGTARVNNVLATAFPKYANDPTGAGVQAYGDWRGRTYSLSLTATF
jgi:outer membrane receptor protein involved in Fe transport